MSILAVISIMLMIGDYTKLININVMPWNITNDIIWLIFAIDYFTRFYLAKSKKSFLFRNIFDLLAIIPFDELFSAFRIFRAFRLLRLFRAFRIIGFSGRLIGNAKRFLKVTGLRWVSLVSIILILVSSSMFSLAEKISFGNSLWWAIVTTTTVGYGDIAPTTFIGRCVAVFLMFTGIGIVGILTSTITNYFSKSNNSSDEKNNQIYKISSKLDRIEAENKIINKKLNEINKNIKQR